MNRSFDEPPAVDLSSYPGHAHERQNDRGKANDLPAFLSGALLVGNSQPHSGRLSRRSISAAGWADQHFLAT